MSTRRTCIRHRSSDACTCLSGASVRGSRNCQPGERLTAYWLSRPTQEGCARILQPPPHLSRLVLLAWQTWHWHACCRGFCRAPPRLTFWPHAMFTDAHMSCAVPQPSISYLALPHGFHLLSDVLFHFANSAKSWSPVSATFESTVWLVCSTFSEVLWLVRYTLSLRWRSHEPLCSSNSLRLTGAPSHSRQSQAILPPSIRWPAQVRKLERRNIQGKMFDSQQQSS